MPIRIKPVTDLGPCILDLANIKCICSLIEMSFGSVSCSAEDGIWEIYDADVTQLISAISERAKLDALKIEAKVETRIITLVFDRYQATIKFSGPYELENWFEHFLIDLRKCIGHPTLAQSMFAGRERGDYQPIGYPSLLLLQGMTTNAIVAAIRAVPYCRIILHHRPPSSFMENIKANLVSNLIWTIAIFVLGFLAAVLIFWVYSNFGIDLGRFLSPPSIPTTTPR